MSFLVKLGLILSLFTSWTSCFTKFLRPPERDPDQEADEDMTKNNQYDDGDIIPIFFETNIKTVDLHILQIMNDGGEREGILKSNAEPDSVSWKAQYDLSNVTENEEDCTYWFRIVDPRYGATLADSQYFNVSAPKPEETKTIPASTILITLTAEATTSTTDASSSKEAGFTSETSSKSGLSKGEIAGVAVGATVGGLLILGVIGWLIWKRQMRRKNDAAPAELPGSYNQDQPYSQRPKSELPAEPVVFPSASPRGPPEVYEAP
ncbi:hypothetical protein KAF25_004239 [Fusarium avenaceum]|uniref:Mid2 domain-containing protein n=1 Tax=Fusarium avenaceum TaxID=40199 RepID=A0A9P7H604_9HYPO|nr:hypothetical protein KAF25_004239 [Fusarium avenaceum]